MLGSGSERILIEDQGGKTLPSSDAQTEIDRLNSIKGTSGRITWAYYVGRAVMASTLMPSSPHNRMETEYWQENVRALRGMVKEIGGNRLLSAGYNRGVEVELAAWDVKLSSK